VTECYLRHPTVVPQQALALANSELTLKQARRLAASTAADSSEDDQRFIISAFQRILARAPTALERETCHDFLVTQGKASSRQRARENLIVVLVNHNDFVTVR
jgi:hypothetical protein